MRKILKIFLVCIPLMASSAFACDQPGTPVYKSAQWTYGTRSLAITFLNKTGPNENPIFFEVQGYEVPGGALTYQKVGPYTSNYDWSITITLTKFDPLKTYDFKIFVRNNNDCLSKNPSLVRVPPAPSRKLGRTPKTGPVAGGGPAAGGVGAGGGTCDAAPSPDLKLLCNKHNEMRAPACAPALTWDSTLANDAQTSRTDAP
jgi:hypothetical protein